jgi:hypothetical protein
MARCLLYCAAMNKDFLDALLETVVGGQAPGCTVTNSMVPAQPMTIASLVGGGSAPFTLQPGQSGTVSPGRFAATGENRSIATANCAPGSNMSVRRDSRWIMMSNPTLTRD